MGARKKKTTDSLQQRYYLYQAAKEKIKIPNKCDTCAFKCHANMTDDWALELQELSKYGLSKNYSRKIFINIGGPQTKTFFALWGTERNLWTCIVHVKIDRLNCREVA